MTAHDRQDAAGAGGWTRLPAVPDLMAEYRTALGGLVTGRGKKREKKGARRTAAGGPDSAALPGSADFEVCDIAVDTAHLAAYCRATGLRLGAALPLTYPYVLAFPLAMKVMNSPGFPFPAVGAVHLSNSIEQTRPIGAGERLRLRVRALNPRAHRAGMLIDMVTEAAVDGEVVWRQVPGFLGKGAATDGLPAAPASLVKAAGEPAAHPAFARVTEKLIAEYAEASGDKNPIHVSALGAKAFGFPSTIAHGMWSAAHMLAGMEGLVPPAAGFNVEFGKPVRLPARVAFTADPDSDAGEETDGGPGWRLQLRSAAKPEIIHAVGRLAPLG